MARPPITGKSDRLFRRQLDAALDWLEANGGSGGGGGAASWASITGKPSTFPPEAHTHVPADIVGLAQPIAGAATITVANNSLSHVETVAASGVTASQRVLASIAPHLDSDENDAEMLDVMALSAAPGTGQITVDIAFATPTAGPIKINWVAL